MSDRKRTVTSVELPEKMLYDLSRLAGEMHLSKSDLIRWGIERILARPPKQWQVDLELERQEIERRVDESNQMKEVLRRVTEEVCGTDEGDLD